MKLTPVLLMDSIERSLTFWTDRMGWQKTVEVPEGDHLGFVILVREGTELMLQTFESVRKDEPGFVGDPHCHRTSLFIEVTDWNDTVKRLSGYEIAMAERETSSTGTNVAPNLTFQNAASAATSYNPSAPALVTSKSCWSGALYAGKSTVVRLCTCSDHLCKYSDNTLSAVA